MGGQTSSTKIFFHQDSPSVSSLEGLSFLFVFLGRQYFLNQLIVIIKYKNVGAIALQMSDLGRHTIHIFSKT